MTSIRSAFDLLLQISAITGSTRCGLVVDVDGTISPAAGLPDEATVPIGCVVQLKRLAGRLPVVVAISSLRAADVQRMVSVEGILYIGNHGLERLVDGQVQLDPAAVPWVDEAQAGLACATSALASVPGLVFENRGVVAAIHYGKSPDPSLACEAISRWAREYASRRGLQVAEGRMAIELLPPVRVDKGTAVQDLVKEHGLGGLIFLGDDLSDARVFACLRQMRQEGSLNVLAVAVIDSESPQEAIILADGALRGVGQVETFLTVVADLLSLPA